MTISVALVRWFGTFILYFSAFILVLLLSSGLAQSAAAAPRPFCKPADGQSRADCPQSVASYAIPSNTPAYEGCYVGGGARLGSGEPRFRDEGVWGWDYVGLHFQRRVWLNWWHGEKCQGGSGAYRTDGPKVLHEH